MTGNPTMFFRTFCAPAVPCPETALSLQAQQHTPHPPLNPPGRCMSSGERRSFGRPWSPSPPTRVPQAARWSARSNFYGSRGRFWCGNSTGTVYGLFARDSHVFGGTFFDGTAPRTQLRQSWVSRGPDGGHNRRQGVTSSTNMVTALHGQSRARTAWAIGCFLRLFFGDRGSRRNMVPNSVS